jgi:single-stranded-DNA-specific exonuclease
MQMKWEIKHPSTSQTLRSPEEIVSALLAIRGIHSPDEMREFLTPKDPMTLTPEDVGIDELSLLNAVARIISAIQKKESIIVYADYDADGVTAGAVLWEMIYALGGKVMPYIPHRKDEGYGLSTIGIDAVLEQYTADLIVTVDHGITAYDKVEYAKSLGIDVIVTDHHTKPTGPLPDAVIVHTTMLSGSGVSWYVARTLYEQVGDTSLSVTVDPYDLLGLASIGTIADLLPLIGPNRALVTSGLSALRHTSRIGFLALAEEANVELSTLNTYDISHALAPRINASGRLEHALDALRLLCTKNEERALILAEKLGAVNRERQDLTQQSALHAKAVVKQNGLEQQSLIVIADPSYNQGIIGLIAGKLVEEFYTPAIVIAQGEEISKASARSIVGFNIVEAIRQQMSYLVDVGGHPMAAGCTIETKQISAFTEAIQTYAQTHITPDMRNRRLMIDCHVPLSCISEDLYETIQSLAPFGMGNYEPVFVEYDVVLLEARTVGKDQKHLKLKVKGKTGAVIHGIGFGLGKKAGELQSGDRVDIVYMLQKNEWNGKTTIELKIKDIVPTDSEN